MFKCMDACGNLPECFPAHLGAYGDEALACWDHLDLLHGASCGIISGLEPLQAQGKASKEAPAPEPLAKWSQTNLFSPKMRPKALIPADRSLCWNREHQDKRWTVQHWDELQSLENGAVGRAMLGWVTLGHLDAVHPAWKSH